MCRWGLGSEILEGKRAWVEVCHWEMVGRLLGWNQEVGMGGVK